MTSGARTGPLAGRVHGQPLDVFLAGENEGSKAKVMQLASDGGPRPIDSGPPRRDREQEAMALLHMQIQGQSWHKRGQQKGPALAGLVKRARRDSNSRPSVP